MGIVTKKGDGGYTVLSSGERVSKDHVRVEACGTLDELSSYLGVVKSLMKSKKARNIIESIQKDLFVIGSEVATTSRSVKKLKSRIEKADADRIERLITDIENSRKIAISDFCLPGESFISGNLDVARTIARRAERNMVTLKKRRMLTNHNLLVYLNRLSDLLYLLARSCAKERRG